MALIGNISEFNSAKDDWTVYSERLEKFLEINNIPEEKKNAYLISSVGADTYKTIRDLCQPTLPKDKTFDELCDLMKKQFTTQVAIYRERNKFYNARQYQTETVNNWFARIKKLSIDCRFGAELESILLDRFISGLKPSPILDRLCEEDETLTLEEAVAMANNKESSLKDSAGAGGNNQRPSDNSRVRNRSAEGRGRTNQNRGGGSGNSGGGNRGGNQQQNNDNNDGTKKVHHHHGRGRGGRTNQSVNVTVNTPKPK